MNITFYKVKKRINSTMPGTSAIATSTLTPLALTGDFEAESSFLVPTIIVANDSISTLQQYNYFSLEFASGQTPGMRYYFIKDISVLPTGRCRVTGIQDVFATYPGVRNSKLHVIASNAQAIHRKTPFYKPVALPVDYKELFEKRISLNTKFPIEPLNGTYVIAICMPEYIATQSGTGWTYTKSEDRRCASLNRSGVGYYTFSRLGALVFLDKIQEYQMKNSDFNLKEKIISIMYLPIPFRDVAPSGSGELAFYIGDALAPDTQTIYEPKYLTITSRVGTGGTVVYSKYTDWSLGYALFGHQGSRSDSFISNADVKHPQFAPLYPSTAQTKYWNIPQINFEPYTTLELNLPLFGVLPVNITDLFNPLIDHRLTVTGTQYSYNGLEGRADVVTGIATIRLIKTVIYEVEGQVVDTQTTVVLEKTAQFGINIPFYGYDSAGAIARQILEQEHRRNVTGGMLKLALGIGAMVVTGGATAAAMGAVDVAQPITAGIATAGPFGKDAFGKLALSLAKDNAASVNATAMQSLVKPASSLGASGVATMGVINELASGAVIYQAQKEQMQIEHGYKIGSDSGTLVGTTYDAFAMVRSTPIMFPATNDANILQYPIPTDAYTSIADLLADPDVSYVGTFLKADNIFMNDVAKQLNYEEQNYVISLLSSGVYVE